MTVVRREYTGRDYDSIKQATKDFCERQFPTVWNDFYEDHLAVVVLEMVSFVADGLAFYQDQQHNEAYRDTFLERQSAISLGKLVGYELRGKYAATVTLTCSMQSQGEDTLFEVGTKISTEDGDVFEVAENTTVTSGQTSFTIDVIHGETQTDTFLSDGTSNQVYLSTTGEVCENVDYAVTVDGVTWTIVDALWGYTDDNVCEVSQTGDLTLRLVFGDGVHGNAPQEDQSIVLTYFSGGGTEGNVDSDVFVDQTLNGKLVISETGVTATVTASTAGSGGEESETVEDARQNMKLSLSIKKSLVSEEDYAAFAEGYAGVLKSAVYHDKITLIVTLVLLSTSYGVVSQSVKDDILQDIDQYILINMTPEIEDVELVYLDLEASIYVETTYSTDDIQVAVDTALNDFFHPTDYEELARTVGEDINTSDIIALIDNIAGVDHVDLVKLTRKLTPVKSTGWEADSDKATFDEDSFAVGTTTIVGTWKISFDFPGDLTKFNVIDPDLVTHATGNIGTLYTSDAGEISFKLIAGSSAMEVGDYANVEVAAYKANIDITNEEFVKIDDYTGLSYEYVT
jgi:hypothetical protein